MKPARVGLVVAAAVALGGVAYVLEVTLPAARQARRDAEELLAPPGGDLVELEVERRGVRMRLTRRSEGGHDLEASTTPRLLRADIRAVRDVQLALAGARLGREIEPDVTRVPDLAQFGLDPPAVAITWRMTPAGGGPDASGSLRIGAPAPDGRHAYAATTSERLVLVPKELLEKTAWGLDHYRQKSVLRFDWMDARRLEITRRGMRPPGISERVVLATDEGTHAEPASWWMREPLQVRAKRVHASSVCSKLGSLDAMGFGVETPGEDDLARHGLSPAIVTVVVTVLGGTTATLHLGDDAGDDGKVWAWDGEGPLVEVRADLRDDLILPDVGFRENQPFTLPRREVDNLRVTKGVGRGIDLELQRQDDLSWRTVRPTDGAVEAKDVDALLTALEGVPCGRFEDELARDASAAQARYHFGEPGRGALRIVGTARFDEGREAWLDLEMVPFLGPEKTPYEAVRTTDRAGRTSICVAKSGAFDVAVKRAREMDQAARLPAGSPDARP